MGKSDDDAPRRKPGPRPGGRKPSLRHAYRALKKLWWEKFRDRFFDLVRNGIPLVVNGVQRGDIQRWVNREKAGFPRLTGFGGREPALMRAVRGLGGDEGLFAEFIREGRALRENVIPPPILEQVFCPAPAHTAEPRLRPVLRSQLRAAEKKRMRRRARPLRQRRVLFEGEWITVKELLCGDHHRGATRRATLKVVNRVGRKRGPDKHPRHRAHRTAEHNQRIARGHLAGVHLAASFRLCPLCGFSKYGRLWHRPCWNAWDIWCHRHGLDPKTTRPPRLRGRGPDPERWLKRNYAIMVARHFGGSDLTRDAMLAEFRRKFKASTDRSDGFERLRTRTSLNDAEEAFLRFAPGTWDAMITKRNSQRQTAVPLPQRLQYLIARGDRDLAIRRLYAFGMSKKATISVLTGAPMVYVERIIATTNAWAMPVVRIGRQLVRLAPSDTKLKHWRVEAWSREGWVAAMRSMIEVLSAQPASKADLRLLMRRRGRRQLTHRMTRVRLSAGVVRAPVRQA